MLNSAARNLTRGVIAVPRSQGCKRYERFCLEYKHVDFSQGPIVGLLHKRGNVAKKKRDACLVPTTYQVQTTRSVYSVAFASFSPFFLGSNILLQIIVDSDRLSFHYRPLAL